MTESTGKYLGAFAPKRFRHNDYSKEMPHINFEYDEQYYPEDSDLPDPQVDPIILGSRVALNKVGVSGVDLPMKFLRRDGTIEQLHVSASLYGSLDDPNAKGLNLSRFPIIMHEEIANHLSIDGMKGVLNKLQAKQGSKHVYCKLKFKYPWIQEALRTRKELPANAPADQVFKVVEGINLSHEKAVGHIFYDCVLESQWHEGNYKFFLTVSYVYSSTCPCSYTLSQDASSKRGVAANGHSQRSIAKITVEFSPDSNIVYVEDIVELARRQLPTEVVIICKRRDEQAFAELNGSNLVFTEDASRLLYQGLDELYSNGKISDFSIVTDHLESLHPWNATSVVFKGIVDGLR